jgi:FkbM family methyltransferase
MPQIMDAARRLGRIPSYAALRLRRLARMRAAKERSIRSVPPNVIYRDVIKAGDIVVDVGCANDADFSMHMIAEHGARAWGVDPTRKHAAALSHLSAECELFHYEPVAVAAESGRITFHESDQNVSGSILADHVNVVRDSGSAYDVEALDLSDLARRIGADQIDILKLDLEGAEYDVLRGASDSMLEPFKQIFVEFHHHAVSRYRPQDTWRIVERLRSMGLVAFTLDDHNFLFYRT